MQNKQPKVVKGKKRILVIAPHADDEVLGCGGYLIHQAEKGSDINLLIGTIGGSDIRQKYEERQSEFLDVCTSIGANGFFLFKGKDAILDTIPSLDITSKIDEYINNIRPDEIFINYKSRHQDHIKIYDCAMASLRLREGYMPKFVALYEYPFVSDGLDIVRGGKVYHDVSDVIDSKIEMFKLYKSQIREAPSPLNDNGIRTLASIRGLECGMKYAEMFYVQKMVI